MDRLEYADPRVGREETVILQESNVNLYDGDTKSSCVGGEVILTNARIIWGSSQDIRRGLNSICLPLRYIVYVEEEQRTFSFRSSVKIILHLTERQQGRPQGPVQWSQHNFIKLSFKDGLRNDFIGSLRSALMARAWENFSISPTQTSSAQPMQSDRKWRAGIVGIERNIQEKSKATDESISIAFQDLSRLMDMAKDMVSISRSISAKIREKQGDITEDETVRFKSYLLSLGIDDPVTRDASTSQNEYFSKLAKQLTQILLEPIKEVGGLMSMTDVYCRVNRARGLELLSPEDLMEACRLMTSQKLGLELHKFDSGAIVLQLSNQNAITVVDDTAQALEDNKSLSALELSQLLGVSVILAKERLLTTEKYGRACRDESLEGVRFYPNLFLTNDD